MKKNQRHQSLWLVSLWLLCLVACQWDRKLLHDEADEGFHIVRYDRVVDDYVATGNIAMWQRLNTEFPLETRVLVERVLALGSIDSTGVEDNLRKFYSDPLLVQLRTDVAKRFEDLSPYECELEKAFSRLEKEVPGFVTPQVYSQVSAFNQSIVVGDSLLGISLDKYLGADYPAYPRFFLENQRVTMEPSRMVQDCLIFYLNQQYPYSEPFRRLTLGEAMIQQGKIAWIVSKLLDKKHIDLAAYQPATKEWYTAHERDVWQKLNNPKLLQSNDSALVHSVVMSNDERPYFSDVHSRGIGLWIGMRIVDNYMKRHPKVKIDSLLRLNNYRQVIDGSGYPS